MDSNACEWVAEKIRANITSSCFKVEFSVKDLFTYCLVDRPYLCLVCLLTAVKLSMCLWWGEELDCPTVLNPAVFWVPARLQHWLLLYDNTYSELSMALLKLTFLTPILITCGSPAGTSWESIVSSGFSSCFIYSLSLFLNFCALEKMLTKSTEGLEVTRWEIGSQILY